MQLTLELQRMQQLQAQQSMRQVRELQFMRLIQAQPSTFQAQSHNHKSHH
jgi:hypothetical protein